MDFILYMLSGIFVYIYYFCCWHKFANKKINFKDYKIYLSLIVFIGVGAVTNYLFGATIKMLVITVTVMFLSYIVVFHDFRKSLISTIVAQITMMICEALFSIFFGILSIDVNYFLKNPIGMVIANVLIPIFGIVMIQFKFINKLYKSFLRVAINLNKIRLVKYSIGMLIIAILLTSSVYMNLSFEQVMLVNTLVIIFYIWIEGKMTSSEVRYQDVEKKYMTSKAQLEAVEKEIDEYKTTNHEMKNTLRMIEDMIKRNDSETLKFIQKLQSKDIERKSVKADVAYQIPLPGLKSLFHDKLLEMENKSIEYDLHISKSVKPSKCHNIEDDDILSLCQIIGVLLDNSIQEVQNLNEKYVSIDIYTNHSNLFISISNNYETEPKIDKIFDAGYTTKGKGHGYGLALVKQIIDKSSNFLIETEVSKTTFRQILEIKM